MQIKSKITLMLPNGIKIKCDPDQIGDIYEKYSVNSGYSTICSYISMVVFQMEKNHGHLGLKFGVRP
jgi:hypothetical protein